MKILAITQKEKFERCTQDKSRLEQNEIVYAEVGSDDDTLLSLGRDADFIMADAITPISKAVIEAMPNLKMIHSEGVGFNKIDLEAARNKDVYVCNCKGMNATAVAEQAILLMLSLLRDVCNGDKAVRSGCQIQVKDAYMKAGSLRELGDCTIGMVGFGDIAKAAARLAAAFGARVVYFDRIRAAEEIEKTCHASLVSMDELLSVSDIVSLHLPVTPSTEKMVNKEFFAKMKNGSYLINTARGELVDEADLLDALRSGKLAGAGLDTITNEPVQADHFLLQAEGETAEKIIYSCHVGGISGSSFIRGYEMFWSDLDKTAGGQRPDHVVNGL